MELRHLRYFIAVAELGSLTEAAEQRLYTSQPSLSRQIKDLEDEVGAELLSRSSRGVELTAAGQAFIERARLALDYVQAAGEAARQAARPTQPTFAVGFLTGQEITWLPEALSVLENALPGIDVTVASGDSPHLAQAVSRGDLDLAFMRAEPDFDLVYETVRQEPLLVLMPHDHPLATREKIAPGDLVGQPFIAMSSRANVLASVIDAYLKRAGVDIVRSREVDDPAMVMSLIAATRGVTLIAEYAKHLMPPSVISRPLAGVVPVIDLVVGYRKRNPPSTLKSFLSRLDGLVSAVNRKSPAGALTPAAPQRQ